MKILIDREEGLKLKRYFAKKGFDIKLSKYKGKHRFRLVKFNKPDEHTIFLLKYNLHGSDFISQFSHDTGIRCITQDMYYGSI